MKKIILLLSALFITRAHLSAQITLDNVYNGTGAVTLVKLHVSGYKYLRWNSTTIELYNVNHSLFKTMSVPTVTGNILSISFVSEQLFDTDNLVEYVVVTTSPSSTYRTYIFKENGTQLLFQDSAAVSQSNSGVFSNQDGVYFDGINTKLKLNLYGVPPQLVLKQKIYTLPGSIPCVQCASTGTIVGISTPGTTNPVNATFYPNPVTDQLKLKYDLPKDYKSAEIRIFDMQGKLIETYKVTDTFDFIYLPSDYNNGLYLYSLNIDGITIKTEKIILDK